MIIWLTSICLAVTKREKTVDSIISIKYDPLKKTEYYCRAVLIFRSQVCLDI